VLLNLHAGRALDPAQVSAIVHLVASSVPELLPSNVTLVDQAGNLLSDTNKNNPAGGNSKNLDPNQLKYVQQLQQSVIKQVESIIDPIVGEGNVRAEATADVDFSQVEQANESYKPNSPPEASAIRSQQTSETSGGGNANPSGVPGALSNQPPQPASAPINAANGGASGVVSTPVSDHKDSTTNYELDKTVRHLDQPMGGIKRLSVAVVVNYLRVVDGKGHASMQPVTADKLAQVNQLVKDAMGFDAARGDSVNVVNSAFTSDVDPDADLPWWRTPDMIALYKQIATYIGIGAVALFLYFVMVKPALRRAFPPPQPVAAAALPSPDDEPILLDGIPSAERIPGTGGAVESDMENNMLSFENEKHKFERNLEFARNIARQDPKIVATVVKSWVSDER
jgi:flagellar M-ring protein FliF